MDKNIKQTISKMYCTPSCVMYKVEFLSNILVGSTGISELNESQYDFDFIDSDL